MITERTWQLARTIHEAKLGVCHGKPPYAEYVQRWPDGVRARENYGHNPQPWCDVAIAQAKAVEAAMAEQERRTLPQLPEHLAYVGVIVSDDMDEDYVINTCSDLSKLQDDIAKFVAGFPESEAT